MTRFTTLIVLTILLPLSAHAWNRQRAFDYLEARQQLWMDWKAAQKQGGSCVSCHTGLPYLMARHALHEQQQRPLERALAAGVKTRLLANDPPPQMLSNAGVDAVLNVFVLSLERRNATEPLKDVDRAALKWLGTNQVQTGGARGSWTWFHLDLHPVESENSNYFGAALAAMALASYPGENNAGALRGYLQREAANQPLRNRLALLLAGSKDRLALPKTVKKQVLRDLWAAQQSDGGWTSASLGPWKAHEKTPPEDSGSNAYATAWAAFTARQAGVPCSDAKLKRALAWLDPRQDAESGAWASVSMNKTYPAGSMQSKFMTDAATGYAAAALVSCKAD